jgi:hypothetical protein
VESGEFLHPNGYSVRGDEFFASWRAECFDQIRDYFANRGRTLRSQHAAELRKRSTVDKMTTMIGAQNNSRPLAIEDGSLPAECSKPERTGGSAGEDQPIAIIRRIFRQQSGKWVGCYWPMPFGKRAVDLNGMKAAQANIMARATSGPEAADWRAAAKRLAQVESDAAEAEQAAIRAVAQAEKQNWKDALALAERACSLEYHHHDQATWQLLRNAIETICSEPQGRES